jgi:hypothetical protein
MNEEWLTKYEDVVQSFLDTCLHGVRIFILTKPHTDQMYGGQSRRVAKQHPHILVDNL